MIGLRLWIQYNPEEVNLRLIILKEYTYTQQKQKQLTVGSTTNVNSTKQKFAKRMMTLKFL